MPFLILKKYIQLNCMKLILNTSTPSFLKISGFLLLLAILITGGCSKTTETTPAMQMKDLTVPGGFSWNATRNVTVNLSNIPAGVSRISSENGSELFAKFLGDGVVKSNTLSLNLPVSVEKISINDNVVPISGNTVDYTFPSATKSAMMTNYSMHFDGVTSWIKVPSGANMAFTNQYSVSAWVKAEKEQTAKIIEKGDWDGLGIGQDLYHGWQTSVAFSDGTSAVLAWGGGQPVLHQWYYIVGTYDGANVNIYVDGVLKASSPEVKTIRANGRTISIGSDNGAQKFFQGLIDEVTIWTTALTPQQVTTGRTNGFTGGETGLQGYWKFNEGSGTSSFDATANQHTGTNIGTLYSTDAGYNLTVDTDQDGVPDSYDDYPNDNQRAFNNYMPSSGLNTLAFEDLWPSQGDYDFNDLVVSYQLNTITNAQGKIVETNAKFILKAIGGSYRNGFGFNLPGCTIPATAITCSGYSLHDGYITLNSNGLEQQQSKPTVIVFDDAYKLLQGQGGSTGVNVQPGATYVTPDTVRIHLTYTANTYTLNQLNMAGFNPFIILNKTRGKEVHLPDFAPTSLADGSWFGTYNDDSKPSMNRYYRTKNNLSWAICVPGDFSYPIEKQDILGAYLKMGAWAQSGGTVYADWYLNLPGYRDNSTIYTH